MWGERPDLGNNLWTKQTTVGFIYLFIYSFTYLDLFENKYEGKTVEFQSWSLHHFRHLDDALIELKKRKVWYVRHSMRLTLAFFFTYLAETGRSYPNKF